MSLKHSHFRFNTLLKNEKATNLKFDALELFPHLNEISFQSRIFSNYAECVSSCKTLMEDMSKNINASSEVKYKVGQEVNPLHSGQQTVSKDWDQAEVARFWVYDKAMEGNGKGIDAICKASIFSVPKVPASANIH